MPSKKNIFKMLLCTFSGLFAVFEAFYYFLYQRLPIFDGEKEVKENNSLNPSLQKPNSWHEIRGRGVGPSPLRNIGASCYLNSAFQGISACNTFVRDITDLSKKYDINKLEKMRVFMHLLDILNGSSAASLDISRNTIFDKWNKFGQQDSYELLAHALNQVYNELRQYKEDIGHIPVRDLDKWLRESLPMRYTLQYTISCGSCPVKSVSSLQSDLAFHVSIPSDQDSCDLSKLFDLHFTEDPIEDYECIKKECSGKGTKRVGKLCTPLPRTICIHLQRTSWTNNEMVKINKKITFSDTLTIKSEYLSDDTARNKTIEVSSEVSLGKELLWVKGDGNEYKDGEVENNINGRYECEDVYRGNNELPLRDDEDLEDDGSPTNIKIIPSLKDGEKDINEGILTTVTVASSQEPSLKDEERVGDDGIMTNVTIPSSKDDEKDKNEGILTTVTVSSMKDEERVGEKINVTEGERGVIPNYGTMTNVTQYINKVVQGKSQNYDLVSVIVHTGTVDGGHYICYKKVGEQWFVTDDSRVAQVSRDEVLSCQAYILFYEQPY